MQRVPLGVGHSSDSARRQAPRQPRLSENVLTREAHPRFAAALEGIDRRSYRSALYWGNRANLEGLQSWTPCSEFPAGVLTTRPPNRPNPTAFRVAELVGQEGNRLIVRGVDALDGSPLLDIKAYAPAVDCIPQATNSHIPEALDGIANGEILRDG